MSKQNDNGMLFIVSGPSGVGKGSVCSALRRLDPHLAFSVSATTRQPRPGEQDGVDYYFLTKEDFLARRAQGAFLEWAEVFDHFYGTLRSDVEQKLHSGRHVILEIEILGAQQVKAACPEAVSIFLLPPSLAELNRRIVGRGTESPEVIAQRQQRAAQEMAQAPHYDYRVVNFEIEQTAVVLQYIFRLETAKRQGLTIEKGEFTC